ncbi:MAG: SMP-30/gluconolactonase/LRE family protein [Alphaproteobacteria bacterium]
MSDLPIPVSAVDTVGHWFNRPECVLATAGGDIFVSHWQGGVSHLLPTSEIRHYIAIGAGEGASPPIATNGFAITPEGDFLLANLHPDGGGVWRLSVTGEATPVLTEVDGLVLPPTNFVSIDRAGRIWATVSTLHKPRAQAYRPNVADGFVVMMDKRGARIVADGLGYTNEAVVDPSGEWLYVNETMGRRTSRLRIRADGSLGPRETVAEYPAGTWPDGIAFDEEGGVWMASVISNRLIRVDRDGRQTTIIEDADAEWVDTVERAFQAGEMTPEHLHDTGRARLKDIASIAFGGPDRRTGYMGNLLEDRIYTFRSPYAGVEPPHWHWWNR